MEISIIIPSKDRKKILFESLQKAYAAIDRIEAEIIIVNDSKTEQIVIESTWKDKIKVFNNPKSGVASARNFGFSKATAELVIFMDDDMWVSEENILTTIRLHKQLPINSCLNLNWVYPPLLQEKNKSLQFGRYLNYYGFDSYEGWCRNVTWNKTDLFPAHGITSQYLSFLRETFLTSGGYNENFPHAGFEDDEFGIRLKKLGIQPYIYPNSMLYHNEADRMDIKAWLDRKRRGGETRRVGVELGLQELAYHYNIFKAIIYRFVQNNNKLFYALLKLIPNLRATDFVYRKLFNLMLGSAMYHGYTIGAAKNLK